MTVKYSSDLVERAKKIKLLALDVDGVLTDGKIIYTSRGEELKHFDVNDGLGIFLMRRSGVKCVIVTAKGSNIVTKRAKDLKIDRVYKDVHYKIEALEDIKKRFGVENEETCFMGDDVIDIPVLRRVGLAVSPPNAMEEVKTFAHFITEKCGGHGAVREVCDFLLRSQGTWDEVMLKYFE
jgi:3-deoxy-D-manno-octulosonate 8-phosphate phosphatase (KDO 8-P phosphatase)